MSRGFLGRRGQGAFEYLLLLGGSVLIAVVVIMMVQGSASGANNTLNASTTLFQNYVTSSLNSTLGSFPSPTATASPTAMPTATPTVTPTPVNGVCGSSSGQTVGAAPTSNLCSSGANTALSSNGTAWVWGCNGINGGTNTSAAACYAWLQLPVVTSNITVSGVNTYGVAVTPNGAYMYVTAYGSNLVSVVNSATNAVVANISGAALRGDDLYERRQNRRETDNVRHQ